MIEKIKTTEENPSFSSPLTPELGQELSDTLGSFGFSLWGHGTLAVDPAPFFEKGVLSGGHTSILEMAIPLNPSEDDLSDSIADPDFMANRWPHLGDHHPNVALLAVPNADPDHGIFASQIAKHLINTEAGAIPPELVVGWYDSETNGVALNSAFDLHEGSSREQLDHIRTRIDEATKYAGPLGVELATSAREGTPTPSTHPPALGDDDLVW